MTRETSIETYNQIKNEGLLSKLRFEVYEALFLNGPMTCRELMIYVQNKKGESFIVAGGSYSTRLSEMYRMGVVTETRMRPCKESGRNAIEWMITSKLPGKMEKLNREKCKSCDGKGYFEIEKKGYLK